MACSRVVLVKLTKFAIASSGGSEAMAVRQKASAFQVSHSTDQHDHSWRINKMCKQGVEREHGCMRS